MRNSHGSLARRLSSPVFSQMPLNAGLSSLTVWLSGVLLKLCRFILGCAIKILSLRLFLGNLKFFEFTSAFLSIQILGILSENHSWPFFRYLQRDSYQSESNRHYNFSYHENSM